MASISLPSDWATRPQVKAAGLAGRALYLAAQLYCCRELTDGAIPHEALSGLATEAGLAGPQEATLALLSCGLWYETSGGFYDTEYLSANPDRASYLPFLESRRANGRKGGRPKNPPPDVPAAPTDPDPAGDENLLGFANNLVGYDQEENLVGFSGTSVPENHVGFAPEDNLLGLQKPSRLAIQNLVGFQEPTRFAGENLVGFPALDLLDAGSPVTDVSGDLLKLTNTNGACARASPPAPGAETPRRVRVRARERTREEVLAGSAASDWHRRTFDAFCAAYHKPVPAALLAKWPEYCPTEAYYAAIMEGLGYWNLCRRWNQNGDDYVTKPETFLKEQRWRDHPPPWEGNDGQRAAQHGRRAGRGGGTAAVRYQAGDNDDPYWAANAGQIVGQDRGRQRDPLGDTQPGRDRGELPDLPGGGVSAHRRADHRPGIRHPENVRLQDTGDG